MHSKGLLHSIKNLSIIITLLFIGCSPLWAQDKRFGVDNKPENRSEAEEELERRYLPTEFNRRFGVRTEASEIAIPPQPPVPKQPTLVSKAAQQVAQGHLNQAIAIYQQAIATKQQLNAAYFGLGNVLMKLGKFDQAAEQFNQLLIISPNNVETELNLGVALFCNNQIGEAIYHYQQAISLSKGQLATGHFNLALAFYHQNQILQAIDHYQQAIKLRKNFANAYNNLGLAYEAIDDYQMAATNYRMAIEQKRNHYPLAHYNLARYYFNQGKFFPEAVDQLNLALKQQPNFPEAYLILGNIYLLAEAKGVKDSMIKAVDYYQKALALRVNYTLAHENLAVAYARLGKQQQALNEYRRAFQLSQRYSPFLLENLIATINDTNMFVINDEFSGTEGPGNFKPDRFQGEDLVPIIKRVLDNYQELDDELKTSADIHYCFGKAYISIGDWEMAINEFANAIKLSNGTDRDAINMLQSIYQQIL